MGSKWTVLAWVKDDNVREGYFWMDVYRGESVFGALRAARKAKRTAGCVKMEWR